jgi:hypothetical protein
VRQSIPSLIAVGVIVLRGVSAEQTIPRLRSFSARQIIRFHGGATHARRRVGDVRMGMRLSMAMHWEGPCVS